MSSPLVTITGFDELQRQIMRLADDKQRKSELLKVLRKTAQGTVKAAKRNAPVSKKPHMVSGSRTKKLIQPKNLQKSIGTITGRKGRARVNPVIYAGPRAKGANDGFYGNWVELGHNIYKGGVKRKRGIRYKSYNDSLSSGRSKAAYFMQTAYNETKGLVTTDTEKSVAAYIQKSINRLSRR